MSYELHGRHRTLGLRLSLQAKLFFNWLGHIKRRPMDDTGLPLHVIFCFTDHYEPGTGGASPDEERRRVDALCAEFPKICERHTDSFGNPPKRTWFFPPHYHRLGSMKKLVGLCSCGLGEIELHLHHGKNRPDTSSNLEKTILTCIEEYGAFGIFGKDGGVSRYGFIHGDWALNNSRGNKFCGVNNETEVLVKTGCYADFTFPSMNSANPSLINSLHYAAPIFSGPKGHDTGIQSCFGQTGRQGLLLVQGPLAPVRIGRTLLSYRMVGDSVENQNPVTMKRIKSWLHSAIHVQGKSNWLIVKVHTHGAVNEKAAFGDVADKLFTMLETQHIDGQSYTLHYVTARELYNIIKAAEAGETGDCPEQYKEYRIQAPEYDCTCDIEEGSAKLSGMVAQTYS